MERERPFLRHNLILDDTVLSSCMSLFQNPCLCLKYKARNWMKVEANLQPQEMELLVQSWETKRQWERPRKKVRLDYVLKTSLSITCLWQLPGLDYCLPSPSPFIHVAPLPLQVCFRACKDELQVIVLSRAPHKILPGPCYSTSPNWYQVSHTRGVHRQSAECMYGLCRALVEYPEHWQTHNLPLTSLASQP